MSIDLRKPPLLRFSRKLVYIADLQQLTKELQQLESQHLARKRQYLFQSYVFHLVAAWEVFIEETAQEARKLYNLYNRPEMTEQKFEKKIKYLNAPDTKKVNLLFKHSIGVDEYNKVSNAWHWNNFSQSEAEDHLDSFIQIRHAIAHKMNTEYSLEFDTNFSYMNLLYNLATITHNNVFSYLKAHNVKEAFAPYELKYPNLQPTDLDYT